MRGPRPACPECRACRGEGGPPAERFPRGEGPRAAGEPLLLAGRGGGGAGEAGRAEAAPLPGLERL